MKVIPIILLRLAYLLLAWSILDGLRRSTPRPSQPKYPERRFRHMLLFRSLTFILLGGYLFFAIKQPLWVWWLRYSVLASMASEDFLNLIWILSYFLLLLWENYLIDRKLKMLTEGFCSYLQQYGYFWLIVLNIIIFFRVDYYYLPLLPGNTPFWIQNALEILVISFFVILQALVFWVRRLRMTQPDPEVSRLVREVADQFRVKIKTVRVWKLERVGNAFATGLFFRSIFLTETLIKIVRPEDLRLIVGHECAHFKLHHLELRAMLVVVLAFTFTWLVEEYPNLNWSIFLVLGIAELLLYKTIARSQEFAADRLAARLLGGIEPMKEALTRVFGMNVTPARFGFISRLLVSHPDLDERLDRLSRVNRG